MELEETWTKAVEKIRAAVDGEKMPRGVRTLLEIDLNPEEIRELSERVNEPADALRDQASELESRAHDIEEAASTIEQFGDAVSDALGQVEEWEDATGEDKQLSRENLLYGLERVVETFDDAVGHELDDEDVEDEDVDADLNDRGVAVLASLTGAGSYLVVLDAGPEGGPYYRWATPFDSLEEANDMAVKLSMIARAPCALLKPDA